VWSSKTTWKKLGANHFKLRFSTSNEFEYFKTYYCTTKDVPFLENLVDYSNSNQPFNDLNFEKNLQPIGISQKPKTINDLIKALQCILRCLRGLHACGYVHCDVRWSNVIAVDDDWYVIDSVEATRLDDVASLMAKSRTLKQINVFSSEPLEHKTRFIASWITDYGLWT
jgi:hypothetical protein